MATTAPTIQDPAKPQPNPGFLQSPTPVGTPPTGGFLTQSAAAPYLNPETDTVEGRITRIADQNSDYMAGARSRGLRAANARGLANSSIATGASEAEALDYALPIAQADAATYAGFGQRKQQMDQQNALNANQYAEERAVKQWEQENLAYSQFLKGVADINMQDVSQAAKDQAVANLWQMYQKGRPISSSLADIQIVDGKIVRPEAPAATETPAGTAPGAASTTSPTTPAPSQPSSYFDFKSISEMPQWIQDSYKARYGNVEPPVAKGIQSVLDYAKDKFKNYISTTPVFSFSGTTSYAGVNLKNYEVAQQFKDFVNSELSKAGLPTDQNTVALVNGGPAAVPKKPTFHMDSLPSSFYS